MKHHHPRGFSLIEAAIVLGIVGLVIGGIWVAASSVNFNLKVQRHIDVIARAFEQGRTLQKNASTIIHFADLWSSTRSMPPGFTTCEVDVGGYTEPCVTMDGKTLMRLYFSQGQLGNYVSLVPPDAKMCTALAIQMLNMKPLGVMMYGGSGLTWTHLMGAPPTPAQITAACAGAGELDVYFAL